MLKVFKMIVKAQGRLAKLHLVSLHCRPMENQVWLMAGAKSCAEHAAPCIDSLLICKLHPLGLTSLWSSSLSPGTSPMEQPGQGLSEQQLQPGCPAREPRVLPGASGGSVGGTLHPQGTSTFPKGSPALAAPATWPQALLQWGSPGG